MRGDELANSLALPAGASWTSAWTSAVHAGGTVIRAEAPLGQIPLFVRDGAALPI